MFVQENLNKGGNTAKAGLFDGWQLSGNQTSFDMRAWPCAEQHQAIYLLIYIPVTVGFRAVSHSACRGHICDAVAPASCHGEADCTRGLHTELHAGVSQQGRTLGLHAGFAPACYLKLSRLTAHEAQDQHQQACHSTPARCEAAFE